MQVGGEKEEKDRNGNCEKNDMEAIEEEEEIEQLVDHHDKDNQDVSLDDEIRPAINEEDKSADGKSYANDRDTQSDAVLENIEIDTQHDQDFDSKEISTIVKERSRKLTRVPIFKEVVKKVIAQNLRKRMLEVASDFELKRTNLVEPIIADPHQDDTKDEPSMKDTTDDTDNIEEDSDITQQDGTLSDMSNDVSPRNSQDENSVGNGSVLADDLTDNVAAYEAKIHNLEEELKRRRNAYEQKLGSMTERLIKLEQRFRTRLDKSKPASGQQVIPDVDALRKSLTEQFTLVDTKVQELQEKVQSVKKQRDDVLAKSDLALENLKIETGNNLSNLNENDVDTTLEKSNATTKYLTGMKSELLGMNNDIDKRICDILSVVSDQRRKYKSKFLEVDTEAARVKIMVNSTKGLLENIEKSLEEIEGGKRRNLIFHGLVSEHPETQIRCRNENKHML